MDRRYRKIHIIGGPGSGKSSIAASISARSGIPKFDLDDLFWDRSATRYGIKAAHEERDRALTQILAADAWIIEGVYYRWLARSFEDADLIIVLTLAPWRRDWRILKRFVRRKFGLGPSKAETLGDLWRLLRWNHSYDADSLQRARQFIAHLNEKIVECKDIHEVFSVLTAERDGLPSEQGGDGHPGQSSQVRER